MGANRQTKSCKFIVETDQLLLSLNVLQDHTVTLRIGLKQASFDQLEKELYEVSDPSHSRYGQHLSTSDIHALTAPTEDALVAVEAWLQVSLKSHHTVQAILLTLS